MKKLFLSLALLVSFVFIVQTPVYSAANNLNTGGFQAQGSQVTGNEKLTQFGGGDQFIGVSTGGERGIYNTLITFAKDLKNLFYAVATVFFLIITFKLIFSSNTEEELGKFKK